ncbi:hypothetical protein AMTR_s00066p00204750, partial [Amborella trichopoda]
MSPNFALLLIDQHLDQVLRLHTKTRALIGSRIGQGKSTHPSHGKSLTRLFRRRHFKEGDGATKHHTSIKVRILEWDFPCSTSANAKTPSNEMPVLHEEYPLDLWWKFWLAEIEEFRLGASGLKSRRWLTPGLCLWWLNCSSREFQLGEGGRLTAEVARKRPGRPRAANSGEIKSEIPVD